VGPEGDARPALLMPSVAAALPACDGTRRRRMAQRLLVRLERVYGAAASLPSTQLVALHG
jgi:hypothetical protein